MRVHGLPLRRTLAQRLDLRQPRPATVSRRSVNHLLRLQNLSITKRLSCESGREPSMPSGTYHEFFGYLQQSKHGFLLLMPDGQRWRVSLPFPAERYAGNDVRVRGIRGPDATLYIDAIEVAQAARRRWQ